MSDQPIDLIRTTDRLFRIRRIQYNTYDIEHTEIRGQLRVITIPKNFLQLPEEFNSPDGLPTIVLGSQTLVSFTNSGEKLKPTNTQITPEVLQHAQKTDLTQFYENSNEPWCEFVLQGDPPLTVRLRTVLTRIQWLTEHVNETGDPVLWAYTNVTLETFQDNIQDSGLT